MKMLVGILALVAFVALLPIAGLCVLGLLTILPKLIVWGTLLGVGVFLLGWLLVSLDPREREIARRQKKLDEELAARNAARAAQEGGPQPSK